MPKQDVVTRKRRGRIIVWVDDVPALDWRLDADQARLFVRLVRDLERKRIPALLGTTGPCHPEDVVDAVIAAIQQDLGGQA